MFSIFVIKLFHKQLIFAFASIAGFSSFIREVRHFCGHLPNSNSTFLFVPKLYHNCFDDNLMFSLKRDITKSTN